MYHATLSPGTLAELHARCFDRAPRPWSAREFHDLLDHAGSFLLTRPHGFLLGRVIVDEAELLTLAVAPEARRQGLGRELADEFAATSRQRGARSAFLEVAEGNMAAIALYRHAGWSPAGRRPRYYAPDIDAIIMRCSL